MTQPLLRYSSRTARYKIDRRPYQSVIAVRNAVTIVVRNAVTDEVLGVHNRLDYSSTEAAQTARWLNEREKGYPKKPALAHLDNGVDFNKIRYDTP